MTSQDWSKIRHFHPSENWGKASKMNVALLEALDLAREDAKASFIVIRGTQGKGVQESEHPKGNAVDFVVPGWRKHWLDLFFLLTRYPFMGIGYYPRGRYLGKEVGSWHVDVRSGVRRALWVGLHDPTDFQKIQYFPFTVTTLSRLDLFPYDESVRF